jgi:CDP-diacylglycerol--glycerol-3-phosphate 3-phosphatidyltransferase
MSVVIASAHWNDDEFLQALETGALPLSYFRHGDHLRFAWIQLHTKSFDEALNSVITGIRKYAAHHNIAHIFHATITTAWVKLLATHREESFAEFIRLNEHRLNRDLLYRFWNASVLDSPSAALAWVPPDKFPLPQ